MARRIALMGMVGLTTLIASCQIKPGEYRVFRIASEDSVQSAGCFGGSPGVDITGDSSTVRAGSTVAIFASDADTYFLDLEAVSYVGVRDGSEYSFSGETVDVELIFGPMGEESQVTTTTIADFDVTIEGKKVRGNSNVEVTVNCSGGVSCPTPAQTVCTTTTDFVGSEIKDVELEHGV